MTQTINAPPAHRLNLCESRCEVRDERWSIEIEADDTPVSVRVVHRKFGDYYDWPEAAFPHGKGNTSCVRACNRAYDLTEEVTFHTRGKALAAGHAFLKSYGAGEVEYLEWDINSQSMVVVGHAPRDPWLRSNPDLLAAIYAAAEANK